MQNAKDTFYATLRDRLAALNPARTMVVRGATRPAVLVEENELVSSATAADIFRLRWTTLKVDSAAALPLVAMTCEIRYATAGNAGNGGMDRGRLLAAMDQELAAALATAPQNATKTSYSATGATPQATSLFWSDPVFGAATVTDERLERMATVEVFSHQEAGER